MGSLRRANLVGMFEFPPNACPFFLFIEKKEQQLMKNF